MDQLRRAIRSLREPRRVSRAVAFEIARPCFAQLGFADDEVLLATLTWGRWLVRCGFDPSISRGARVMIDAFTGQILWARAHDPHDPDGNVSLAVDPPRTT